MCGLLALVLYELEAVGALLLPRLGATPSVDPLWSPCWLPLSFASQNRSPGIALSPSIGKSSSSDPPASNLRQHGRHQKKKKENIEQTSLDLHCETPTVPM